MRGIYRHLVKPTIDKFVAGLGLLVVSPLLLFVFVALFIESRKCPIFVQRRPGLHGRPFGLIKFKTMRDQFDEGGRSLPDEVRMTRIGRIVRQTSMDELLQFVNVLKGEMSVVGPRPLLEKYLPLYSASQARRHDVRPGITGLAQVNGRNAISWEKRFELDVHYVDRLSFHLDVAILWKTVGQVVLRRNIDGRDGEPLHEFRGSSS